MGITPSNSTVKMDVVNEEIEEELKSLRPAVEAFLKNPESPIWIPPQHTMPDIQKFITELRIPTYPNRNPSLLLHGLDKCDGQKIKEVFDDGTPMYVVITSLNFLSRTIAGVSATHLDRVKPGGSWKPSRNIGVSISLQLRMRMTLAFEICGTP